MNRRQLLATGGTALLGAVTGYAVGRDRPEEIQPPDDGPEYGDAEIASLAADPTGESVADYGGFQLAAEYETGTDADRYSLPTIYIVNSAAGAVLPQVPAEYYDPGESGTYEMGFAAPEIDDATAVIVHMGGEADRFEVSES